MATGRLINRRICLDKAVHNLSSDTCRLAFTWAIVHLDKEGRIHGDPAILKSLIFPRRADITIEIMESFIGEWAEAELVKRYEAKGDIWLWFPAFKKNQPNLRSDREQESEIPAFEDGAELLRQDSGKTPARLRQDSGKTPAEFKRREEKRREENLTRQSAGAAPAEVRQTAGSLPAAFEDNRSVYHLIEDAFIQKNKDWNYGKEGKHLLELEKKCLARPDPEKFAKTIMAFFWQLTHSNDSFFKQQPFLPSVLNSNGIWPRVIKRLENKLESINESAIEKIAKEISE